MGLFVHFAYGYRKHNGNPFLRILFIGNLYPTRGQFIRPMN